MRKNLVLMAAAGAVLALASCSSKLGELPADYFTVTPNPLEAQAGQVPATIAGTFPEKYMKKKAVVTVTPELRYGNQVAVGTPATFQGEKVTGNDQTISYKVGGKYTMRSNFAYVPEMQKSELYLTFNAKVGKKVVEIPAVKVADGVIATSELYKNAILSDGGLGSSDAYQRISKERQEAQIKFLVNQANIRKTELQSNSVQDFVKMLKEINADQERLNLKDIEISAYASPEGAYDFNNKLAGKRQDVAEDYVNKQLKETGLSTDINAHYTAEDWDGFQQLVAVSNIQDKDVILRVLNMYKDPEEREKQIRNMSEGYRELADAILPELRRSRMIINYDIVGRSDAQITEQFNADPAKLSIEELLYAATLTNDNAKKMAIYTVAAKQFPNDYRAANNLATLAMQAGNVAAAKQYAAQALKANANAAEALANQGLLNLVEGNIQAAEANIAKASQNGNVKYAQGMLNLAKGNYTQAANDLKGQATAGAALAQIMNKNYAEASAILDKAQKSGVASYLQAISAARSGNNYAASSYLKDALQKDANLSKYAENDLELLQVK